MFIKFKMEFLERMANGYADLASYYTDKAIVLVAIGRFDDAEYCLAKSNKYLDKVVNLTAQILAIA